MLMTKHHSHGMQTKHSTSTTASTKNLTLLSGQHEEKEANMQSPLTTCSETVDKALLLEKCEKRRQKTNVMCFPDVGTTTACCIDHSNAQKLSLQTEHIRIQQWRMAIQKGFETQFTKSGNKQQCQSGDNKLLNQQEWQQTMHIVSKCDNA